MDLPSLDERKDSEQKLNQLQHTLQHLVRLLQIAVDGNCDMAVRQIASIQLKNFIAKHWSPEDGGQQRLLPSDKELVRDNILVYVTQVPTLLSELQDERRDLTLKIKKLEAVGKYSMRVKRLIRKLEQDRAKTLERTKFYQARWTLLDSDPWTWDPKAFKAMGAQILHCMRKILRELHLVG